MSWKHPVFGPDRPRAAREALFRLSQARAAREANGWDDRTLDAVRAAEADAAHYWEYSDAAPGRI